MSISPPTCHEFGEAVFNEKIPPDDPHILSGKNNPHLMDEQNYSQSVYAAIGGEILIKDRCAESFHWDLINWQAIFMDILIKVGWLICSNI